jgi:hypothetical protein
MYPSRLKRSYPSRNGQGYASGAKRLVSHRSYRGGSDRPSSLRFRCSAANPSKCALHGRRSARTDEPFMTSEATALHPVHVSTNKAACEAACSALGWRRRVCGWNRWTRGGRASCQEFDDHAGLEDRRFRGRGRSIRRRARRRARLGRLRIRPRCRLRFLNDLERSHAGRTRFGHTALSGRASVI